MAYQDTRTPRPSRSSFGPLAALLGLLAIVLVGWGVWEAFDQSPDAAVGVTVGKVVDEPESYEGQFVTLSGEIEDVITPSSFTLSGSGWQAGDLLVVDAGAGLDDLDENDLVQVGGDLHLFDERFASERELSGAPFEAWKGKPVLMATTFAEIADAP